MIKDLLKLAQELDNKGLKEEADKLDSIAQDLSSFYDEGSSEDIGLDDDDIIALTEASGSSEDEIRKLLSEIKSI